jgi:hypothetical protein
VRVACLVVVIGRSVVVFGRGSTSSCLLVVVDAPDVLQARIGMARSCSSAVKNVAAHGHRAGSRRVCRPLRLTILSVPETRPGILSRRFARRDRTFAMPPVCSELTGAPTNERIAQAANTPKQLDLWVHPSDDRARRRAPSDRTIRVDRPVSEIDHTMTAARTKPQVSGPDEFSAPTGAGNAFGCAVIPVGVRDGNSHGGAGASRLTC